MIVGKLSDTHRGWVIGDFEPSLLKTKDFEVGIDSYLFYDSASNRDDSIATLHSTAEGYAFFQLTDNTTLLLEGTLYTELAAIL